MDGALKKLIIAGIVGILGGIAVGRVVQSRAAADITVSSPREVTASGRPGLLVLGAQWCPGCRAMKPVLKKLGRKYYQQLKVGYIDVDKNRAVAESYGARAIPLLVFYNSHGTEIYRQAGAMSPQSVVAKFKSLGIDITGGCGTR